MVRSQCCVYNLLCRKSVNASLSKVTFNKDENFGILKVLKNGPGSVTTSLLQAYLKPDLK